VVGWGEAQAAVALRAAVLAFCFSRLLRRFASCSAASCASAAAAASSAFFSCFQDQLKVSKQVTNEKQA
jgi:hypothetical protein